MRRFWKSLGTALMCTAVASAQTTIYVSPCGDDAWSGADATCAGPDGAKGSIQAAIDSAVDGDTVLVLPGTYIEIVDFIGKGITLTSSEGAAVTVIDGTGAGDSVVTCASGEGTDPNRPPTILKGFTITNGSGNTSSEPGGEGGGMRNFQSSPIVVECVFTGNACRYGAGMYNRDGANPRVINCRFFGNSAESGGGMFNSNAGPIVRVSLFAENVATVSGGGIFNQVGSVVTLVSCTVSRNDAGFEGGGVLHAGGSSLVATDSIFWGNTDTSGAGTGDDAQIRIKDVATLSQGYACTPGDINGDGVVNITDLAILLTWFGASCP